MNKIDFRKTNQRIGNIYIWENEPTDKFKYSVGINGTNEHHGANTKQEVRDLVNHLQYKQTYNKLSNI